MQLNLFPPEMCRNNCSILFWSTEYNTPLCVSTCGLLCKNWHWFSPMLKSGLLRLSSPCPSSWNPALDLRSRTRLLCLIHLLTTWLDFVIDSIPTVYSVTQLASPTPFQRTTNHLRHSLRFGQRSPLLAVGDGTCLKWPLLADWWRTNLFTTLLWLIFLRNSRRNYNPLKQG